MLLLLGFFVSKLGLFCLLVPLFSPSLHVLFILQMNIRNTWTVQTDNDMDGACVWDRERKQINFTKLPWGSHGWIWPNFASLVHTGFFPCYSKSNTIIYSIRSKIRASVTHLLHERCINVVQPEYVNMRSEGGLWNECSFQFAGWSYCLLELKRVPRSGFLLTVSPASWLITAAH